MRQLFWGYRKFSDLGVGTKEFGSFFIAEKRAKICFSV